MVNVICMKWGSMYGPEYVNHLRAGVARHLRRPHRFVCFTDDGSGLDAGVEVMPLPELGLPGGQRDLRWRKLAVFGERLGDLTGTTLFLDLDWATGFVTIVLAHIMFQVSFVTLTVKARVRGFDWSLEDASMDLGATPVRTFWRVTFPLILPGIVAAAMLSFALSLDDFIITVFNSGNEVTYPLYVNNGAKTSLPPQINVLATMILIGSLLVILLSYLWTRWRTRGAR